MASYVALLALLSRCLSNIQGSTMHPYYAYILAIRRNGTLYVGSTSDIIKRVWEHKYKVIPGFTAKYNVHMLVYYEMHDLYIEAARRENRFKNWSRQWKINLIEKFNPEWRDLYQEICQ
jgi:putative endonuclease